MSDNHFLAVERRLQNVETLMVYQGLAYAKSLWKTESVLLVQRAPLLVNSNIP